MSAKVALETKRVDSITVRQDPAREPCFEIVHRHEDVPDKGGMDLEHRCQRIHREYNQEVQNLEVAALCIVDFPEAPWDLRLELAHQCWDEGRHAELFMRRLVELGGYKGMHPIVNLDWSVVGMIDTLAGRLAVQHQTFEAGSLDIEEVTIRILQEVDDYDTAAINELVGADEIPHVGFANYWLKRLADDDPRTILQMTKALAWLREVVDATIVAPLHEIPTNVEGRKLAGFSEDEIAAHAQREDAIMSDFLSEDLS